MPAQVPAQVDVRPIAPARGSAAVPAAGPAGGRPSVTLPVRTQAEETDESRGPQVPLPRRRAGGEPRRWPAVPPDDGRVAEECSESTLMRIHRALRALR
jgi:hypothetical protein